MTRPRGPGPCPHALREGGPSSFSSACKGSDGRLMAGPSSKYNLLRFLLPALPDLGSLSQCILLTPSSVPCLTCPPGHCHCSPPPLPPPCLHTPYLCRLPATSLPPGSLPGQPSPITCRKACPPGRGVDFLPSSCQPPRPSGFQEQPVHRGPSTLPTARDPTTSYPPTKEAPGGCCCWTGGP